MGKHYCQCCDREIHTYDTPLGAICTACWWEEDLLEEGWSSANGASLVEYRAAWKKVSKEGLLTHYSVADRIWELIETKRESPDSTR